jgi:uncharacterized protein (TIGR02145 family)
VWAKSNLASEAGFAPSANDAGAFFQWGVSTPWSATGDPYILGTGDTTADTWPTNVTGSATDMWPAAQDPSPAGWRIPTPVEFAVLTDDTKVTKKWLPAGTAGSTGITYAVNGYEFTDVTTPANVVFFPAAGYRVYSSGALMDVGSKGHYWSDTPQSADNGLYLSFFAGSVNPGNSYYRTLGTTLRLVKDVPPVAYMPSRGTEVVVGDVVWAGTNVASFGTFAATADVYDVANQYTFAQAQTACPIGWRLPTVTEFYNLVKANTPAYTLNTGTESTIDGKPSYSPNVGWSVGSEVNKGTTFTSANGTLFFSASGGQKGSLNQAVNGYYWTSSAATDNWAYHLNFNSSLVRPAEYANTIDQTYSLSVRCVRSID